GHRLLQNRRQVPNPRRPAIDCTSINTKLELATTAMQYVFYVACLRQIRRLHLRVLPCASISPTSTCFVTSSSQAASPTAPNGPISRSPPPRPAFARWNWHLARNCWCEAAPV